MKYILAGIIMLLLFSILGLSTAIETESVVPTMYLNIIRPEASVTYGDGIEEIWFLPETIWSKNVSVEGQNDTNPAFRVENIGTETGTGIETYLSENTPTGFDIKCDDDNNPTGATVLNTTHQNIYNQNISIGETIEIWCWSDWSNPTDYYEGEIDFVILEE